MTRGTRFPVSVLVGAVAVALAVPAMSLSVGLLPVDVTDVPPHATLLMADGVSCNVSNDGFGPWLGYCSSRRDGHPVESVDMGNLPPGGSFHGVTPGDVIREFYVQAREGGYVMDPDKGWTHTSGRDWGATARRFLGVPRAAPTP